MTRVELTCRWILVHLLIEQLTRGPGFTRLPPAHYWHNHVNEKHHVGAATTKWIPRDFVFSRRKWMLDPQVTHYLPPQPTPMRMPAKSYKYCDVSAPNKRTITALKILESIEEQGEVCAASKSKYWTCPSSDCDSYCMCIVVTTAEFHRHACVHGEWRLKTDN